ncbi:hypothetical protein V6N12_042338 [Hibiscus sabdariffa]|uniref:Uncharacterized protein n=1 Tax=Hibiscus sabdariffa TaxID=183260 RepID=A0ABR2EEU7_9ROSI
MENKADARRTEAQLLNTFDYAWNKGSNGVRRHDDILQKLDKHASNLTKLANFTRKHLPFLQKQVGIKIKSSKILSDDNEFSKHADGENHNFLRQVVKFSRSQPRLVSDHGGSNKNDTITCGVVLEDGSICRRPPAEGRKRCAEHKGKKTKGYSARSSTSYKSVLHKGDYPEVEQCGPICGVAMVDGSLCTRQPVSRRKRFDADSRFDYSNQNNGSNSSSRSICGAPTRNGAFCQITVKGNGRCWQHCSVEAELARHNTGLTDYTGCYSKGEKSPVQSLSSPLFADQKPRNS